MPDAREVTSRPPRKHTLWFLVGLGAAGAGLAAVRSAYRGGLDGWVGVRRP
jgi:hypothetical protein